MGTRTFRVVVRGVFEGLSTNQRAELLACTAEHDVLRAAFTPDGHLGYDLAARSAFTFRFLDTAAPRRRPGERLTPKAHAPAEWPRSAATWSTSPMRMLGSVTIAGEPAPPSVFPGRGTRPFV